MLHLSSMPTTLPRHTITETPPVREALDELRAKLRRGEGIDYAELVALGARVKARRLSIDEATDRAELKRIADTIRTGSFPWKSDIEAAEEVKYLKLIPKYE